MFDVRKVVELSEGILTKENCIFIEVFDIRKHS